MRHIRLAKNSGFCFGVKRALDIALNENKNNKNVYTLGPLIHNNDVVDYLKQNGIFPIDISEIDKLSEDDTIIIRSHGVSPKVYELLKKTGLKVIDATCPFVKNIQEIVKKYYSLGYSIIIVGDKEHPEVKGINGFCNDNAIITSGKITDNKITSKVCIVSQTTERQFNYHNALCSAADKYREIVAFNTICSATYERQTSAEELSKKVDAMVIIGGKQSSNTAKLFDICNVNCKNTIYVENSGQISDEFINNKFNTIGVTAGASTPEWIIKEAIIKMEDEKNMENNEQLEYMNMNDRQIINGEIIEGKVISVTEKESFLNIGYKSDGLLPESEFLRDDSLKMNDVLKEGDSLKVKVIRRKNDDGYVVLSTVELERENAFNELNDIYNNKKEFTVKVKNVVNGGVIANYKGNRIFIPASHLELYHVNDLNEFVGREITINLIEFSQSKRGTKIVGSRRELLKKQQQTLEEAAWLTINKNDTVEGEVKRLTDFGAFINVNGVDGLLHVSQISWGRVEKPADVLKIGDKVTVKIIDIDKDSKKISLSIKALLEDPWNNVDVKYPVGSIVLGKIVRFSNFGAFVELEPGVDALVHISEISSNRINKPSDVLTIGQQIKAKLLEVNKDSKKIGLSIKEAVEI